MTDITELAQREKFEAWFVNDVVGADVTFPAFEDGAYAEGEIYDEQLYFMLQAMWMAWKAAGAELVEALESEKRICATWRKTANSTGEKLEKAQAINAAAEKLVRCKGRYHSEQNYRALAALFGVKTPDLPPLEHENVHYADAAEMEIAALRQRIAELESRTVKLPAELYTIGELIRTQDNRITDQPMFVVFQKREIIGSDEHSPSRICWVWDGEEVSEPRAKRLEALYQDGRDTRGYDRYAMQEVDEFVTACFTEHGCKDYLRQNGHNLRLPYIYACGSFRNNEYQLVRNWLAGIKVEAE